MNTSAFISHRHGLQKAATIDTGCVESPLGKFPELVRCTCGAKATIDPMVARYYHVECSNIKCGRKGPLRMRKIDAAKYWNREIREYGELLK